MRNEKNETMEKKVNKLGLIAGGTGITPMFQIIQKVQSAYLDRTALSIIYATKSLVFINLIIG